MRAAAGVARLAPRIAREVPRRFQGGLAFAVFKPVDPESVSNWAKVLSPLTLQRRGPDLLSLVCVQTDDSAATALDDVVDADFVLRAHRANEGQQKIEGGGALTPPRVVGLGMVRSGDLGAKAAAGQRELGSQH